MVPDEQVARVVPTVKDPIGLGSTVQGFRICSELMSTTLSVIAPGLLGASVAQAARQYGVADRIKIWARRPEIRLALRGVDWCDEVCDSSIAAAEGGDVVVICTPVDRIVPLIHEISSALGPTAIVTDVGSVKGEICRLAAAALTNGAQFVGSHPMAGSEKSGMEHATPDLFQDRPCFVTPLDTTPPEPVDRIVSFWDRIGSRVVTMHPDKHDEIVARVSHLPHLVASALCSLLGQLDPTSHRYAGGGLRDTTRVAGGSPDLWLEILLENRDEVIRALGAYQEEIQHLQSALANRDTHQIVSMLQRGKVYRDQFPS